MIRLPSSGFLPDSALPRVTAAVRLRLAVPALGRIAIIALLVLLLQSLFWTERVPIVLKIAIAAVPVLTAIRPQHMLLVVAGLAPFCYALTTRFWDIYHVGLAEALILGFLAGYVANSWRGRPSGHQSGLAAPVWFFASVVLASCVVQIIVAHFWHDYPIPFAWHSLDFLTREYLTTVRDARPWVDPYGFVSTAALLLEGPAVFLAAAALSRQHPGLHSRLGRIVILAGAGAASLTFVNVAAEGLATGSLLTALEARRGGFVPSINSTGAFFALPGLMAVGAMVANRKHRRLWSSAAAMMFTAMLLTQTRAAIIPTFTIIGCVLIWWIAKRNLRSPIVYTSAVVALVLTAGGLFVAAFNAFELLGSSADNSLRYRLATAQTAIRMVKEHSLFGVGIANYAVSFNAFRDPVPEGLFGRGVEEVHNHFLWITAEMGLIGLMGFLWLIGTAVRKLWQRLWIDFGDWEFLGMSAGIATFLLTCVLGQPLIIPEIAFTFWIVLGAAVAAAPGRNIIATSPTTSVPRRRITRTIAAVAATALVAASVPARTAEGVREIDFSRVTYGIGGWEEDLGARYRWTEPHATFFVRSPALAVTFPVRTVHPVDLNIDHFDVRFFVDGNLVKQIDLPDAKWHQIRLNLPSAEETFRRVDIRVSPPWSPPQVFPGTSDKRTLGVQIGDIWLDSGVESDTDGNG